MSEQNDNFFERSYATGTDLWSTVAERDRLLKAWLKFWAKGDHGTLLDIGCGVARHARIVCPYGWRYVGIDKANGCIEQARENIREFGAELVTGDILTARLGVQFDAVIDFACFTHLRVDEWKAYQQTLFKHTRPGSRFLLSVWSAESTGAYGVEFEKDTREYVVGYHGGVYTRLFTADDMSLFCGDWLIGSVETVTLQQEPVAGLKHLFVAMRRPG